MIETGVKVSEPGVYKIAPEDYHAERIGVGPCLSRGIIRTLLFESAAKAWWNHPVLNPDYKPDHGEGRFDVGVCAHSLLLEGLDKAAVIDASDWRTKEAKAAREKAWAEGKTPLLKDQYEEARTMVLAAERQIIACQDLGI